MERCLSIVLILGKRKEWVFCCLEDGNMVFVTGIFRRCLSEGCVVRGTVR